MLHAIGKEIEHLKGFIRFRETAAGVYYAACAPDNDILPQLARHFIGRLACPFILHDIARAYALCYNGASVAKSKRRKPTFLFPLPKKNLPRCGQAITGT